MAEALPTMLPNHNNYKIEVAGGLVTLHHTISEAFIFAVRQVLRRSPAACPMAAFSSVSLHSRKCISEPYSSPSAFSFWVFISVRKRIGLVACDKDGRLPIFGPLSSNSGKVYDHVYQVLTN